MGWGWYLFSFASGLTMIVLPCTLPLAFVIVPLSMGKGALKGLGIAAAFGLGVALTLSAYGVLAAIAGEVAIGALGTPLETVKNWLYLFAGAAAYLFALGEIGLLRVRMPTYTGAAPAFIQRRQDYLKALFLGLFLGNIGVGCPHPATPVLLTRIAASGDVFYGWMLFAVHALGRVLPLLLIAILGIMGVNALRWIVARKDAVERATGWGMVFVGGFILVLGLFTHDWWVVSGQHTFLEAITREETILGIVAQTIGAGVTHTHAVPSGTGLFELPLRLGNWTLAALWIMPLFWFHFKKKKEQGSAPAYRLPFFMCLSLLIALVTIYVLPDRFFHEASRMPNAVHEDGMASRHPVMRGAVYHEALAVHDGPTIFLSVHPPRPVTTGTTTRLEFFANEQPGGIPISVERLQRDHTKLMHVIGVREDLTEFFHLHPEPAGAPGLFIADHVFRKPGRYELWSEIKKDDTNHLFDHDEIIVEGAGVRYAKDVFFGRSAIAGDYQVLLDYDEPLVTGAESDIAFDVRDLFGRGVAVAPYLAADMHLSVIKDDLTAMIHAHPEDMQMMHEGMGPMVIPAALAHGGSNVETKGEDEKIAFHIVFPEAGIYKLFAQFRPAGAALPADEALTASFWVRVEEEQPFALSPWWMYLVISVLVMTVLSVVVHQYLRFHHA